jgi:hypothetical protein
MYFLNDVHTEKVAILEGEPAPPTPTKEGERKHLPKVVGENASDILKLEKAELELIISNFQR